MIREQEEFEDTCVRGHSIVYKVRYLPSSWSIIDNILMLQAHTHLSTYHNKSTYHNLVCTTRF
jgi:hypothetical protein